MRTNRALFIITDFVNPVSSETRNYWRSLAAKLAQLHTTPAPIPEGFDKPMYGFPVIIYCNLVFQDNSWKELWAEFFARNRLRSILCARILKYGSVDLELGKALERVATWVVPRLIGDDHLKGIKPVVIHNLRSEYHGRDKITGSSVREEVVITSSAVYGHSEYELGIMTIYGWFSRSFWDEYLRLVPKADPKDECRDRLALYQLYHLLNHNVLYGRVAFWDEAMEIMEDLLAKYVEEDVSWDEEDEFSVEDDDSA